MDVKRIYYRNAVKNSTESPQPTQKSGWLKLLVRQKSPEASSIMLFFLLPRFFLEAGSLMANKAYCFEEFLFVSCDRI